MLIIRTLLDLSGDDFSPIKLMEEIRDPVLVFHTFEATDYNDGLKENYGFGSISILHPQKIGLQYELEQYEKWYVEFIEKYHETFLKHGVQEINLFIDAFYSLQCNFEIFDKALLRRITKYDISIPVSVVQLSSGEIREIMIDAGFDLEKVNTYVEENG